MCVKGSSSPPQSKKQSSESSGVYWQERDQPPPWSCWRLKHAQSPRKSHWLGLKVLCCQSFCPLPVYHQESFPFFPVHKPLPPSLFQKFKLIVNIYKLSSVYVICIMYVHVHLHVCARHLHVCACIFASVCMPRVNRRSLSVILGFLFWDRVSQQAVWCMYSCPCSTEVTDCTIIPCWWSKPRSSGLHGKHFTEWAISIAPRSVYDSDSHLKHLCCPCRRSAMWQSGSEQPKLLLKELYANSVFSNSCSSSCGHLLFLPAMCSNVG